LFPPRYIHAYYIHTRRSKKEEDMKKKVAQTQEANK
jgi:hypothetical protein